MIMDHYSLMRKKNKTGKLILNMILMREKRKLILIKNDLKITLISAGFIR